VLIEDLLSNVTGPESDLSPSGLGFFARLGTFQPRHNERTALLSNHGGSYAQPAVQSNWTGDSGEPAVEAVASNEVSFSEHVQGLNALEVAAITGAKKFLGAKPIQQIITAIW